MQKLIYNLNKNHRTGFTMVEMLIAVFLLTLILFFAYRVFFSQTEVVTKSIEFMQVNDSFRKVMTFMGDDIRESTDILLPKPIFTDKVGSLLTKTGVILKLVSSQLDPTIPFDSPFGGQISQRREIVYELERVSNPDSQTVPRFKLTRTATVEEKPGKKSVQRQELVNNIRDLMIYRTVRKPFKPANISGQNDRIVLPRPLYESGTGNSLVHLRMVIERDRKDTEHGQVYNINMNTSFYKRGKEIFKNP
jgi:prepilin-type N-terminal cleavage/methylation domain-containing protein